MSLRTFFTLVFVLLIGAAVNTACASPAKAAPAELPAVDLATLNAGDPYGLVVESPNALNWVEMDENATQQAPQMLGAAKLWFRNGTPEMELEGVFFRIWNGSTEGQYNVTDGTYTVALYNPHETFIAQQGIKDGESFFFRLNTETQRWEVAQGQ